LEVAQPPPKVPSKPKALQDPLAALLPPAAAATCPVDPPQAKVEDDDGSSSGSDEEFEIVEVVGFNKPEDTRERCKICGAQCESPSLTCLACGEEFNETDNLFRGSPDGSDDLDEIEAFVRNSDLFDEDDLPFEPLEEEEAPQPKPKKRKRSSSQKGKSESDQISHLWPRPVSPQVVQAVTESAMMLSRKLDNLAVYFRQHREAEVRPMTAPRGPFWNGERYADALELFGSILRNSEAVHFMERVSDDALLEVDSKRKVYTHIIKNPLCFKDIASSLFDNIHSEHNGNSPSGYKDGRLPGRGLAAWNMWKGMDLLQSLDLVLLNSLAYGKVTGEGRSRHRARTNELRKFLWTRIQSIVAEHVGSDAERRRQYTPTRRSESSGFVVFKYKE
jgi:hypothetical protein